MRSSNIKNKFLVSIICTSLLSACSTTQQPQTYNNDANTATLRISRPSKFFGVAIRAPIYVNGEYIGKISSGGDLTWKAKSGRVTVSTSEGRLNLNNLKSGFNTVTFNAKKGQTYNLVVTMPPQLEASFPWDDKAGAFKIHLGGNS